ncbi:hypothetical protein KIN20_013886 [Parelaphostrongylus tenuis]|uniref:DRBM domain-containing protein n=1 Tax=Parelaphostrongylus tenuis TaxID=148309 RepID=A0AAD5QNW2_PARTN|nr:hypothetical protein KIN20_013886 [Parelaphostrongylus tenuis]
MNATNHLIRTPWRLWSVILADTNLYTSPVMDYHVLENKCDFEPDDTVNPAEDECNKPPDSDAMAALSLILADTNRYTSPVMDYHILENKCDFGLTQCLLKITFCRTADSSQAPARYVFAGSHSTEEGAKQRAAQMALTYFNSTA